MSDTESEFSDNLDLLDQLINEQKHKSTSDIKTTAKHINVKFEEATDSDDTDEEDKADNDGEDNESENKSQIKLEQPKNPLNAKSRARKKLRHKKLLKQQELEEKRLTEYVFGNREQLLKNIEIAADGDTKEHRKQTKRKREVVWADSDDEGEAIIKNVDTKVGEIKRKEKYKKQLENKFQRIAGTPAWAELDRERKDDDDSDDEILRTAGHLASGSESASLSRNLLTFKRMKDLNRVTYAEGPSITGIEFHPTSSVSLVTGSRGIATIYSIDGKKNDKLHSMAFKNFPIRCCRFNRDGSEAIFGGSQKYFYNYNLIGGQTQRIFLPKQITKMIHFEVSPCGQYIAVIGRFGEVHLLHTNSKELICTFKQQSDATSVAFSMDSMHLFSHGNESEVHVFDIRQQQCVHRFIDDGCINGSCVTISPNGKLLAAGSEQGVVNVYHYNDMFAKQTPTPVKTILNLTTAISTTKFNHSSEILAIASKEIPDAVKLVHFPSGTVFSNFPGVQSNFGKPDVVQFSPQSGYLAIGNHSKEVALYRLKHFNNY